jgi:Tfp pilus tip-associated adhesin PilY1
VLPVWQQWHGTGQPGSPFGGGGDDRAGGSSVYALDVTHVDSLGSSNVLWEFSAKDDAKLGYTIGNPVITKLANGRPAVIFGNGYNQSSGTTASLFVLYLDKQPGTAWTQGSNYFRIDLPTPSLLEYVAQWLVGAGHRHQQWRGQNRVCR